MDSTVFQRGRRFINFLHLFCMAKTYQAHKLTKQNICLRYWNSMTKIKLVKFILCDSNTVLYFCKKKLQKIQIESRFAFTLGKVQENWILNVTNVSWIWKLLKTTQEWSLTPSYDGVPVEVTSFRKESLNQQSEEIQTFNEQPEIVGHDTVMEENHHCFTCHLHRETHGKLHWCSKR